MRFLIGVLLGVGVGYAVAGALSRRMDNRRRDQPGQLAQELPPTP
jgi:hypothetical protein